MVEKRKKLVIVESPSKAKTINRILGKDFVVRASLGHVRDLPEHRLGVDIRNGFQPEYVTLKSREKAIREIREAARQASLIYLAPDPDREGEAIAWHLRELLRTDVPLDRFRRILYNEITAPAIRRAIENPTHIDMRKVDAQQARRVLDRLVGYMVSPLLWRRVRGAESAGRVQSVALRLICEREKAIREFVPEEYWVLGARVAKRVAPRTPFVVRLVQLDGQKPKIPNDAAALEIKRDLEGRELRVRELIQREIQKRAQPPFITSTLQQAAARALGFTPERTMRIAQTLYEGVDLGDGPVGLITYMRTDSVTVAEEALEQVREYIGRVYGPDYLPARPNVYRSRATAQEAHEAIRPTDVNRTPDQLQDRLKPDEWKLYKLVWERFVASQMSPARIAQRTAEIEAVRQPGSQHEALFRATASEVVFPGYMRVLGVEPAVERREEEGGEEEEEETPGLPPLERGEGLDCLEWLADQKFTQPPPRYSDASLVKALEEHGIGRPSTYAQIIATLLERGYVTRKKRQLTPTPLGEQTNEFLITHLEPLFNVRFTAQMEEGLDEIEKGTRKGSTMLEEFYQQLEQWLQGARGPAGNVDEARDLIDALAHVREWREPPEKEKGRGRGYVGDRAFYESLRRQLEAGEKPLSARQVEALRQLVLRYHDQAPEIAAAADRWGIAPAEKPEPRNTDQVRRKLELMSRVDFEPPRKVGRRVFDDRAFFQSLKQQVDNGRALTEKQEHYLDRLLEKYADQIPNFPTVAAELGLNVREPVDGPLAEPEEVQKLLQQLEGVGEWDPPQKIGRRVWDDREFVQSVARQFRARGSITQKQFQALQKIAEKYAVRD